MDSKEALYRPAESPTAPKRRARALKLIAALLVATQLGAYLWVDDAVDLDFDSSCASSTSVEEFDWAKLKPSANLTWVKCFEDKECARLSLPLDYSRPKGEQAAVAMIKVPAAVPSDHKDYGGPILFNPGGPGGSGVGLIFRFGERFRTILGPNYDLIGFDPRGLGHTTPVISFFKDEAELTQWNLRDTHLINSTSDALARTKARYEILGHLAGQEERSANAAKHVSTAVVARDMLEITKAHGRDKLLYWGFSYGSILGATYAAMFPNNIGRLIIDGVADSENYYASRWDNNLRDTQRTLEFFYDSCATGGPGKSINGSDPVPPCPLYAPTSELVRARVNALFDRLKISPVPVYHFPNANSTAYDIVDFTMAKSALFVSLYKPFDAFPRLAQAFKDLEDGDGRGVLSFSPPEQLKCGTCSGGKGKNTKERFELPGDLSGGMAIRCSDGEPVKDSLEELREHFERLSRISEFADGWAGARIMCAGYKPRAAWRFAGPFVGNTSFPLLVIGNTADPVTPLWAAHKMSKGFKDAVVLTQNSAGHCSLSAASLCTAKAIRSYFHKGELPAAGTTCETQDTLFGVNPMTRKDFKAEAVSEEDQEILEAMKALRGEFEIKF